MDASGKLWRIAGNVACPEFWSFEHAFAAECGQALSPQVTFDAGLSPPRAPPSLQSFWNNHPPRFLRPPRPAANCLFLHATCLRGAAESPSWRNASPAAHFMTESGDAAHHAATDSPSEQGRQQEDSQQDVPQSDGLISREGTPPPLPPRPKPLQLLGEDDSSFQGSLLKPNQSRPALQSKATTALSLAGIHTYQEGSGSSPSRPSSRSRRSSIRHDLRSRSASDVDDTASIRSYAPTLGPGTDAESLLGEVIPGQEDAGWRAVHAYLSKGLPQAGLFPDDPNFEAAFEIEFDEVVDIASDGSNQGQRVWSFFAQRRC